MPSTNVRANIRASAYSPQLRRQPETMDELMQFSQGAFTSSLQLQLQCLKVEDKSASHIARSPIFLLLLLYLLYLLLFLFLVC